VEGPKKGTRKDLPVGMRISGTSSGRDGVSLGGRKLQREVQKIVLSWVGSLRGRPLETGRDTTGKRERWPINTRRTKGEGSAQGETMEERFP